MENKTKVQNKKGETIRQENVHVSITQNQVDIQEAKMVDQVNVCAITIQSSENRYDVLPNHFPNSHPTG